MKTKQGIRNRVIGTLVTLISLPSFAAANEYNYSINTSGQYTYQQNKDRDTNELIVYTPDYGDTTQTNQFGYEVTVENGIITLLGGADSAIPSNGFILSGHGEASQFLTEYSIVGSQVELDPESMTVTIETNIDSYHYQATTAIHHAEVNIQNATDSYYDFPKYTTSELLTDAKSQLAAGEKAQATNPELSYTLYLDSAYLADKAYYHTIESEVVEQRGIWHRPDEKNLGQVNKTLKGMRDTGFNSVYLEVTFWGYTIYPSNVMSEYGMTRQHPHFSNNSYGKYGSDILKAYIEEAAKLGMTVQGWTNGFMIGSPNLVEPIPPQISARPDWLAIQNNNRDEAIIPDNRYGYFWLDLVQYEVQDYMLKIYQEMQEEYDITGLNIDYMRYPHYDHEDAFTFSSNALNQYQQESGIPDTEILRTDKQAFAIYEEWIRQKENEFIRKLSNQSKVTNPNFMFTATPEPGPEEEMIADWKDDIDGVIPQAYGHDFDSIHDHVNASKKLMPEGTIYYTGIYSFYHFISPMGTVQDVLAGRNQTSGVNMFAYGQGRVLPNARNALRDGPWRESAFNPGEDLLKGVKLILEDIELKFNAIYIPQGAVTKGSSAGVLAHIETILTLIDSGQPVLESEFSLLISKINQLSSNRQLDSYVATRLQERLQNAMDWNNHYHQR